MMSTVVIATAEETDMHLCDNQTKLIFQSISSMIQNKKSVPLIQHPMTFFKILRHPLLQST